MAGSIPPPRARDGQGHHRGHYPCLKQRVKGGGGAPVLSRCSRSSRIRTRPSNRLHPPCPLRRVFGFDPGPVLEHMDPPGTDRPVVGDRHGMARKLHREEPESEKTLLRGGIRNRIADRAVFVAPPAALPGTPLNAGIGAGLFVCLQRHTGLEVQFSGVEVNPERKRGRGGADPRSRA